MTETIEMKKYALRRILINAVESVKDYRNIILPILTAHEIETIVSKASFEELDKKSVIIYLGNSDLYRFEHDATYNVNEYIFRDIPEIKKTSSTIKVVRPLMTDMEIGFKRTQITDRTVTGKKRETKTSDNCQTVFDIEKLHVVETYEIIKHVKESPEYSYKEDTKVFLHIYIPESRIR